jgi:hypothetical protein
VRTCELINLTAKAQGSQRAPDFYAIYIQYDINMTFFAFFAPLRLKLIFSQLMTLPVLGFGLGSDLANQ